MATTLELTPQPATVPRPASTTPERVNSGESRSAELAAELERLETTERTERDRRAQEELAKQRDMARFD